MMHTDIKAGSKAKNKQSPSHRFNGWDFNHLQIGDKLQPGHHSSGPRSQDLILDALPLVDELYDTMSWRSAGLQRYRGVLVSGCEWGAKPGRWHYSLGSSSSLAFTGVFSGI